MRNELLVAAHQPVHGNDRKAGEEHEQEEHDHFHKNERHKFDDEVGKLDLLDQEIDQRPLVVFADHLAAIGQEIVDLIGSRNSPS